MPVRPTWPSPALRGAVVVATCAVVFLAVLVAAVPARAVSTTTAGLISATPGGAPAGGVSGAPDVSANGRYVAFHGNSERLAPVAVGHPDWPYRDFDHIYVRDRSTGTLTLASRGPDGRVGIGSSYEPSISGDGRYVAFISIAWNLERPNAGVTTDFAVFVRDLVAGTTTRVSRGPGGAWPNGSCDSPEISQDGMVVAFSCQASTLVSGDTNRSEDVFVHDRRTGVTSRVSVTSAGAQGNGDSLSPSISADGRYVSFASFAANLVPGDTNRWVDAFVHDRTTRATTRASVTSAGQELSSGAQSPVISADGRLVAFATQDRLVAGNTGYGVSLHDRSTGRTDPVPLPTGWDTTIDLSADGRVLAVRDPGAGVGVVIHDRTSGRTVQVAPPAALRPFDSFALFPSLSGDGRYVAFDHSTTRPFDPLRSEVHGSPVSWPAPAPHVGFVPLPPQRAAGPVRLGSRGSTVVDLSGVVPAGAAAVAVNVTLSGVTTTTYASVCPTSVTVAACAETSTVNAYRGRDVANAAVPRIGPDRKLRLYNNAGNVRAHVDVVGYFADVPGALDFRPVTPARDDERPRVTAGGTATITLDEVPPGATAVALRTTVAGVTGNTYVSVCPADQPCGGSSSLNANRRDVANMAVVPIGPDGRLQVFNSAGSATVLTDVLGWFTPAGTGSRYVPVAPTRAAEFWRSWAADAGVHGLAVVPTEATAVAANITVAGPPSRTYVSACPGDMPSEACARTSTVNPYPGQDTAATTFVRIPGEGYRLKAFNNVGQVVLFADVQGYFVEP